jgi:hypothetical protein
MRWAQQAGAVQRQVDAGWETILPGGGSIAISVREGKFIAIGELTREMRSWSPERLLSWQFENAQVCSLAASPESSLRIRVVLPLDALVEEHLRVSLDALAELKVEGKRASDWAVRRKNLAAVKQWWEREYGGLSLRQMEEELLLRFRAHERALPIRISVRGAATGVRISSEFIAGDFVARECREALVSYLLELNGCIALGGLVLARDGSPSFSVTLPAPLNGALLRHGFGALRACHEHFAATVKAIACRETIAGWWSFLNTQMKGGEG